MIVSISDKCFEIKPQSKEISSLYFKVEDLTIIQLANYISNGFCYCNVFNNEVITIKDKTKYNFRYSNIISVDIDHTKLSMDSALSLIITKPSIAYETYSNGKDGLFSYRFIYALSEPVDNSNIHSLINYFYNKVESELNTITDKRTKNPYQYFNGTFNKKVVTTDIEYCPSDLILSPSERSNTPSGITIPKVEKRVLEVKYDSPFLNDFFNLNKRELLDKYRDSFINKEHTDLPTADEDTPIIYFPSNFREIRRYWYQTINKDTHIRRIKDGMGRRHKLFINGIIRRLIEPTLTIENILYNLVYEMYFYIDNRDKAITNIILYNLAKNIYNADLTKYNELGKSKRKYMANPLYCIKHNLRKNTVSKMKIDYNAVGELYDCSLTDKENCKVMSEYGIKIKLGTLRKWRQRNNIQSGHLNTVNSGIEMYKQRERSIMNLNTTPNGTVTTSDQDNNNIIKDNSKMVQERTKRIDYSIVNEVVRLCLSERKSVELLKNRGVSISKTAYHKYLVSLSDHINNKVTTEISDQVNTTERTANIEINYNGTILKAYEKRHRSYPVDGLSDYPLYMVIGNEELKDYQFLDSEQLIKVGIDANYIYNWNEGRCQHNLEIASLTSII